MSGSAKANGHGLHYDGGGYEWDGFPSADWGPDFGPGADFHNGTSHAGINATMGEPVSPTHGLEFDNEIEIETATKYILKGILSPGDFIILFGPSGCGKSFLATFIAYMAALKRDVFGRKTKPTLTLYVALEGQAGFRRRMSLAAAEYGTAGKMVARLTLAVGLDKANGAKGIQIIVKACERLAALVGMPVGLIVIDTLNRAIPGDDENSAQDTSAFVSQCSKITNATGAAILVVHHCGKDAARGMRGSSALFAAADAVIQVDADKQIIIDKCKDGETGTLGSFRLVPKTIGIDDDGDKITSCVVEPLEGEAIRKTKAPAAKPTPTALRLLNLIHDAEKLDVPLVELRLKGLSEHRKPRVVRLSELREQAKAAQLSSDGIPDSERKAFARALDCLEKAGLIQRNADYCWTLNQQPNSGPYQPDKPDKAGQTPDMSGEQGPDRTGHHPLGVSRLSVVPALATPSFGGQLLCSLVEPIQGSEVAPAPLTPDQLADGFK